MLTYEQFFGFLAAAGLITASLAHRRRATYSFIVVLLTTSTPMR